MARLSQVQRDRAVHMLLVGRSIAEVARSSSRIFAGPKLMTDTQHSTLNIPCIWMGYPEHGMSILSHFKIPNSNTWIWGLSFKCGVLRNRHKFKAWLQNLWWIVSTLHSGFTLHTQDSPIQIHWVLSMECWISVISLGPVVSNSNVTTIVMISVVSFAKLHREIYSIC